MNYWRKKIAGDFAKIVAAGALSSMGALCPVAAAADVAAELRELRQENVALREELRGQKDLIASLAQQMADLQKSRTTENLEGSSAPASAGFNLGKIHISGEGGVGFFSSGSEGTFPHSEFRVDEAKLFVESPVWENTYVFGELNLAQRESSDLYLNVGEFYLDFEDVSLLWNRERQLNVRVGRMDTPFGEEYLKRDAIDNPLISHSLSDFWGVDEGIELYGALGKFSYCFAVQNGGNDGTRDFNKDKAIIARVGYDPKPWLHVSVSAMRTGDLDASNDGVSALWFGNGFFQSIGSTNTTLFHANLVEGDVAVRWRSGHLKAFGGAICYDDNDPAGSNRRTMYYYSVEAQQQLARKFYGAARFSQILAGQGYPIVGNGDYMKYTFGAATENLWRLSLGLGYRWNENLLLKTEYSLERGRQVGGETRTHEDLFAVEAAVKF